MKRQTTKAYDTDIEIYESTDASDEQYVRGITDEHERILILQEGQFTDVPRDQGDYYIAGYVHGDEGIAKIFLATAKGIDLKQAANLLIGLGADQGIAIACDLDQLSFSHEEKALDFEALVEESVEELKEVVVPEPQKKAPRKRTKKTQE